MKKVYKVTATETVYYEKIVEADNVDEAYEVFVTTCCDDDVIDSCNFEVDSIVEEIV